MNYFSYPVFFSRRSPSHTCERVCHAFRPIFRDLGHGCCALLGDMLAKASKKRVGVELDTTPNSVDFRAKPY